jgi:flavodoxin
MDIKDVISLFEKYGFSGGVFALFILLLIVAFKTSWVMTITSKISEKFVERFMKKKTKDVASTTNVKQITESDITNHDIFNYIDFWTYSKVPTFQFSTDYRTAVFRKYLVIYLKCYKKDIQKFVNEKEYQQMDDAKIWKALLNTINTIVFDYEREMTEAGIPKVVIEKMKAKNNDTITLTIDLIEGICTSQFYDSQNNYLKVYSILNILLSVLENTIGNSESVCNSINGQLKGLVFSDGINVYKEP